MDFTGASSALRSRFMVGNHSGRRFLDQLFARCWSHLWCYSIRIDGGQNGAEKITSFAGRSISLVVGNYSRCNASQAPLYRQILGRSRCWSRMRPWSHVYLRNRRSLDQRNIRCTLPIVPHRWNFCLFYSRKRSQLHSVRPCMRSHHSPLLDYLLLDARISRLVGGEYENVSRVLRY